MVLMPTKAKHYSSDVASQIEQLNQAYRDSATALARKQMPNLIHEIAVEANQDSLHRISENGIQRIIALSSQFSPTVIYKTLGDSLVKISAERGQLFLQVLQLNLDSGSFNEIKTRVNFNYSDLRKRDLTGFDLSNAQLNNAHFENAKLDSVNFMNAVLHHAHFNGAQLSFSEFKNSNLEGADFSWSTATGAKFNNAHLNGAILNNARFSNADLSNTSAEWAWFNTTDLTSANLDAANLKRAYLTRTNFNNCSLRKTSLYRAEIVEASFLNSKFDSVLVYDADWIRNFKTQNVEGLVDFEENYLIIEGKNKSENWIIPQ